MFGQRGIAGDRPLFGMDVVPSGGGTPRRPTAPGVLAHGDARPGADPLTYEERPEYLWMDDALHAMPAVVRDKATQGMQPEEWRVPGRWFADNGEGCWRLLVAGKRAVVLATLPHNTPPPVSRYNFVVADQLESNEFHGLKPVPSTAPDTTLGRGGHQTVDAPLNWPSIFGNLPHRAQEIVEHWFPPDKAAMRWCTALRTRETHSAQERIWVVAASKSRVVYIFASRTASDPFDGRTALEKRLVVRPWQVLALRGHRVSDGNRELSRR